MISPASISQSNLESLQSAVSMSMLKKTMNQDANAVATLMQGMQQATPANPQAAAPKGLLDIRV